MYSHAPRTDFDTARKIDEALAMKQAFGLDAARKFLQLRGIDAALTERVLTAPREQLRH
ncbi:hypothetical protein [Massilia sp. PWRC2]|uniref:hypothetical protein n=1 Tax=Massilia sp. PWRC2 TaxID=2804626 RepID=UPI003CF895B1